MATFKVRKYGDSIYVVYSHKEEIFKIFTGAKTSKSHWNNSSLKRSCPDFDILQRMINEVMSKVLTAATKIKTDDLDPTATQVRMEYYRSITPKREELPFWQTYQEYLDLLNVRASTRKNINKSKIVLEYFCSYTNYRMDINSFDRVVFGRFIQYMVLQQHMADSTVATRVKWLRAFLKYAYPDRNFAFVKYIPTSVEVDPIALNESELKLLIHADLGGSYMDKTRDLFVFLATTGMRYCDSQLFNPSWVTEDDVLQFSQLKTGGMAYPPLYEASRKVLLKYGGIPPQISNQKFNKYLKDLFEKLKLIRPILLTTVRGRETYRTLHPLSEVISSHTARRTFITICLQKGMPIQDVMKMSGHNDYKSMKPYIRITRQHIRSIADKWEI